LNFSLPYSILKLSAKNKNISFLKHSFQLFSFWNFSYLLFLYENNGKENSMTLSPTLNCLFKQEWELNKIMRTYAPVTQPATPTCKAICKKTQKKNSKIIFLWRKHARPICQGELKLFGKQFLQRNFQQVISAHDSSSSYFYSLYQFTWISLRCTMSFQLVITWYTY